MVELPDSAAGRSEGARGAPYRSEDRPSPAPPLPWRVAGAALLLAAGLAFALSLYLIHDGRASGGAFWTWLLALALLPVGLNFGVRDPLHLARPPAGRELVVVLGILALATLLRLPALISVPPGGGVPAQAAVAEFERAIGGEAGNPWALDSEGVSHLGLQIWAPLVKLVGDPAPVLIWGGLLQGVLSILLLHLVGRRLVPWRFAASTALLLAILPWHIQLGRGSPVETQMVVAPLLLLYLVMRALDSGRPIEFLLAGYAAGLCLLLPPVARAGLLIALGYLLIRGAKDRSFLPKQGPGLLVAALGGLLFVVPPLL